MDFKRPIQESIKCDEDGYVTVSGLNYKSSLLKIEGLDLIQQIIDTMGELSAKAQKLYSPITSLRRLFGTNQKIFMKVQGSQVLGFIKVGTKNLFHRSLVSIYGNVGWAGSLNPAIMRVGFLCA